MMRINKDPNRYLSEIQDIVSQLRARGKAVTEEDHIQYIVNGLTPKYTNVRTYLQFPNSERTVSAVSRILLNIDRMERPLAGCVH